MDGRPNYRARHWKRDIADHYCGDCCAAARRARAGVEDFCALGADRIEPGESDGPCFAGIVFDHCDRRSDHDYARRAENYRPVRQARSWPQNVRGPNAIHAFKSELRRRDADHLRLGPSPFSCNDCQLRL